MTFPNTMNPPGCSEIEIQDTSSLKASDSEKNLGDHSYLPALGKVETIRTTDAELFTAKVEESGQRSWLYYFPFLYAFGCQRQRKLYWETINGSICLYYIRHTPSKPLVSLYLPPFPFSQYALKTALEKLTDISGPKSSQIITWVEEKDKETIRSLGFDLHQTEREYLYSNETYQSISGKRFKRLRENLHQARRIPHLAIRPFEFDDRGNALQLIETWHDFLVSKGEKTGGSHHLLKTTLQTLPLFPSSLIKGWVVTVAGNLAAFYLCGPITSKVTSQFIFCGNHHYPSLSYLMHMTICQAYALGAVFNSSSDAGRSGIRHMKETLQPTGMNQLFRAVREKGQVMQQNIDGAGQRSREKFSPFWPTPTGDPMWAKNPTSLWSSEELTTAIKGEWLQPPPKGLKILGVNYRFKEIRNGDLFFLRNRKHWRDGNDDGRKIESFFSKGARCIVTSNETHLPAIPEHYVLRVQNTRRALIELGMRARDRFQGIVIGITGSAGKTSTKEMVRFMLAHFAPTVATRHNLNHTQGIALSLAQSPPQARFGVYEFAIGDPTYTELRKQLLRPAIAAITTIHPDHLQHYPSVEAYADEKCRLFDSLHPGGPAILNRDSIYFQRLRDNCLDKGIENILTFGEHPASSLRLLSCTLGATASNFRVQFGNDMSEVQIPLAGRPMVQNALAALAIVAAAGIDWRAAAALLRGFEGVEQRMRRILVPLNERQSFTLIDDTYNANVGSVKAALHQLDLLDIPAGAKRIVVLGGMEFLGDFDRELHESLAEPLRQAKIDRLFLCDPSMRYLYDKLKSEMPVEYSPELRTLQTSIISTIDDGDVLLIKCPAGSWDKVITPFLEALRSLRKEPLRQSSSSQSPQSDRQERSLLTFLGDFSFGENYQDAYAKKGEENVLLSRGYDYLLGKIAPLLRESEAVIANLETPLTHLRTAKAKKRWQHYSNPDQVPLVLKRHNILQVSLSNNHVLDFGRDGVEHTLSALSQEGIGVLGWGKNFEMAMEPWFPLVDRATQPIAVIAGLEYRQSYEDRFQVYATTQRDGLWAIDPSQLGLAIAKLRADIPGIFVIVCPHWGRNYQWRTERQRQLAHALINAGADLVVGHGAHMLQEVERFRDRWIVYSIGNSVFASRGRYDKLSAPPYSLIARLFSNVQGGANTIELRLYPLLTDNQRNGYQCTIVKDTVEGQKIVDLLVLRSNMKDNPLSLEVDHHGCFVRLRCLP